MKKISLVIQARYNSSRLPGKILLKVNDKTFLNLLIDRLNNIKNRDKIIIATANTPDCDIIYNFCKNHNILCYRGSEEDVYSRFFEASQKYNIEHICRITSDNPLLDYEFIDTLIDLYKKNDFDYIYSLTGPIGVDSVSIYNVKKLHAHINSFNDSDHEHVTQYITRNPNLLKIYEYKDLRFINSPLFDFKLRLLYIRLTLDNEKDLNLLINIFKYFKNTQYLKTIDLLNYLNENKYLLNINDNPDKINMLKYFIDKIN